MITGMSLCSSTLFAALRLLFLPSCIIHSQVSPMSDLHVDMGRAPWTAEGKPSGIMAVMMKRAVKKKIHQYILELPPIFCKLQTTFRLQKLIRYQVIFFFFKSCCSLGIFAENCTSDPVKGFGKKGISGIPCFLSGIKTQKRCDTVHLKVSTSNPTATHNYD